MIEPAKILINMEEKMGLNMKTNTLGAQNNFAKLIFKSKQKWKEESSSTCIPGETCTCTFSWKRQAAYKYLQLFSAFVTEDADSKDI